MSSKMDFLVLNCWDFLAKEIGVDRLDAVLFTIH